MKLSRRLGAWLGVGLFFCALLFLTSCYKGSLEVSSLVAQPYVNASSGSMGLSLYFTGSLPSENGLTMAVSSPDGVVTRSIFPL